MLQRRSKFHTVYFEELTTGVFSVVLGVAPHDLQQQSATAVVLKRGKIGEYSYRFWIESWYLSFYLERCVSIKVQLKRKTNLASKYEIPASKPVCGKDFESDSTSSRPNVLSGKKEAQNKSRQISGSRQCHLDALVRRSPTRR